MCSTGALLTFATIGTIVLLGLPLGCCLPSRAGEDARTGGSEDAHSRAVEVSAVEIADVVDHRMGGAAAMKVNRT